MYPTSVLKHLRSNDCSSSYHRTLFAMARGASYWLALPKEKEPIYRFQVFGHRVMPQMLGYAKESYSDLPHTPCCIYHQGYRNTSKSNVCSSLCHNTPFVMLWEGSTWLVLLVKREPTHSGYLGKEWCLWCWDLIFVLKLTVYLMTAAAGLTFGHCHRPPPYRDHLGQELAGDNNWMAIEDCIDGGGNGWPGIPCNVICNAFFQWIGFAIGILSSGLPQLGAVHLQPWIHRFRHWGFTIGDSSLEFHH